ncbi:MAG: histidine kinase [Pseudomonadota bacterium]
MPTLTRLVVIVAVTVGVIYGALYALANYVEPNPREMIFRIPPERLNR